MNHKVWKILDQDKNIVFISWGPQTLWYSLRYSVVPEIQKNWKTWTLRASPLMTEGEATALAGKLIKKYKPRLNNEIQIKQ